MVQVIYSFTMWKKGNEMLKRSDKATWLDQVWAALWEYREKQIPEGDSEHDEEWDDLCTAMAWILEELNVEGE